LSNPAKNDWPKKWRAEIFTETNAATWQLKLTMQSAVQRYFNKLGIEIRLQTTLVSKLALVLT